MTRRRGPLGTDALKLTDPPHDVYERHFRCHGSCGKVVRVGPFHEHIDPETFVCGGCRNPARLTAGQLDGREAA